MDAKAYRVCWWCGRWSKAAVMHYYPPDKTPYPSPLCCDCAWVWLSLIDHPHGHDIDALKAAKAEW